MNRQLEDRKRAIEVLNQLTRGAISAHETYGQALSKAETEGQKNELMFIRAEHRSAIEFFRDKVKSLGGEPELESGVWGQFAKAVMGSSKVFGNSAALKALKEGEEHGRKEYRSAVKDEKLPIEIKSRLAREFIPSQERHIASIDRYLEAAA